MRMLVLAKVVPDTYGERRLSTESGLVDRTSAEIVLDEIGERAVEAAVTLAESHTGSTVTVVSMGPADAVDALKKTLAIGADEVVHIVDDALLGADLTLTAEVLAAAVRQQAPDLVLLGNVSTDGGGGVMGAMLAEILGFAQITNLASLESDGDVIRGARITDRGVSAVEATLPAVASVTEALPEARFPSLRDTMTARRKPMRTLSAVEIGADPSSDGSARSIVIGVERSPARPAGTTVVDDGTAGRRLGEFLIEKGLA